MKRVIFSLLAAATMTLVAQAQKLAVTDFHADPSDMEAQVNPVQDLSGDPCALIKIGTTVTDMEFEGDIIKTVKNGNEYWVYIIDGANWITINTPTFTPLHYEFQPVAMKEVYLMTVEPDEGPWKRPTVTITLPAKGAGVSIGGQPSKACNSVTFNMIQCKSGNFLMGATDEQVGADSDEKPVHWARFDHDFYIGETEVSQALWEYVMGSNPSLTQDASDDLPVDNICWDDAVQFCQQLSAILGVTVRLPTEAEWEYAARGGHKATTTQYPGSNIPDEVAWYAGNSGLRSHNVHSKKPNELGIYNMAGNVWEFCLDFKNDYPKKPEANYWCQTPDKNKSRVRRGGGWDTKDKTELRTSYRRRVPQGDRQHAYGMRIVIDPQQ